MSQSDIMIEHGNALVDAGAPACRSMLAYDVQERGCSLYMAFIR
jgi:hypothetical protein